MQKNMILGCSFVRVNKLAFINFTFSIMNNEFVQKMTDKINDLQLLVVDTYWLDVKLQTFKVTDIGHRIRSN